MTTESAVSHQATPLRAVRTVRFVDEDEQIEHSPTSLAPTPPQRPPLAYIAMREESALEAAERAQARTNAAKRIRRDSTLRSSGLSFYRILFVMLLITAVTGGAFIIYGIVVPRKPTI